MATTKCGETAVRNLGSLQLALRRFQTLGRESVRDGWLAGWAWTRNCACLFTFAELLMGAGRSSRKPDVLRRLDALTRVFPVDFGVNRTIRTICER